MDGSHATLRSLEELLNEFFGSATNNERKRQIEELLNQFALQDGSWIQCLFFLDNCANSYVHMYSLSVLESLVNRRWHSFPGTDKQQVRKFLYNLLVSKHKEVAPFIRNKCIKVMVNIGRMDWPMFYPAFFSNIMQLVKEPNTTLIGVIALQMVSEEFISPREDLNMSRRNELKEQLLRHIPDAFRTLTEILNSFIHKSVSSTTVTPPPSPNQSSPFHTPQQSPHHSPVNHLMINGLFPIQRTGGASDLDKNSKEICICIFSCLTQYISWLPLSQVITPALVSKVFQFAEYGCNFSMNADKGNCELGIHALSCINEIMSKKFIPAEYESFLMQMFQQTFNFLNTIIKEASGQQLSGFDESYLEKFTEFLSLFVSNHFSRFESHINLPTVELLTMLLKYTLAQESAELFMECLDIWVVVLDYLINKVTSCITANNKLAATQRYIDFLQQFLVQLLHKVQYCHNEKWLSQLDMEKVDSDVETEWEKFMKISLDVFGKISELIPEETFDHASQIFKQNIDVYFGLSSQLSNGELNIGHSEVQSLHSSMIDLSTSFRLMGRLSSIFTEEVTFQNRLGQANSTLDHLLKGALFGCYYKTSSVNCASLLSKDLIEVQSQAIGAVQAYIYWLTKLHMLVINNESHSEKFRAIISTVLDVICATIEPQLPSKIQLVGAHLLLSLSATVRPRFFLTLKQVQKLFSEINKIQELTDRNVKYIIFKGLSNALILPWPLTNSQEWDVREATHKMLISSICKDLYVDQQSLHQMQTVRWKDSVKCTFHILSEVVESVSNEGTQSRRIVYLSLKEILDLCLKLLVACVAEPDVAEGILQFLLASVKWLKVQMGSTFVEKIIQTLLTLLNREQMVEILKNGNPASCCVLEKFIKMLEIIVQDPDQSFKKLLPSILAFSLQNLLPALTECNFPDLNVELLELFHQLLLHNWRYFFKSDVVSKLNGADQLQHEQDLLGILKAYGDPLLKNEIFLFKKSLETLNSLNDKHRLFEKAIFQSSMLSSFLHVLLDILIQNSHGLLQEEIIHSVYSMVVYNFEAYFNQFIPHYLMNITGITDHQRMQLHANYKRHQDVPSFTTSLQQFVGDLRYYQIINSGIPSGSVQL